MYYHSFSFFGHILRAEDIILIIDLAFINNLKSTSACVLHRLIEKGNYIRGQAENVQYLSLPSFNFPSSY